MIEIRNLTKIYKKQTVLNDVNLRLEMGENLWAGGCERKRKNNFDEVHCRIC